MNDLLYFLSIVLIVVILLTHEVRLHKLEHPPEKSDEEKWWEN